MLLNACEKNETCSRIKNFILKHVLREKDKKKLYGMEFSVQALEVENEGGVN